MVKFKFLICLLLCYMLQSCGASDLKKHGTVVNAKIIEMLPSGKAGVPCSYRLQFIIDGTVVEKISSSSINYNKSKYIGQYFPAIYSQKADAVRVLMTPKDFGEFNIPFPDSLISRVVTETDKKYL